MSLIILNENNYYSFRPGITAAEYTAWPTVAALASLQALQGLDEDRANALIDIDRPTLEQRMRRFYDPSLEWNEFAEEKNGLTRISAGFDPQKVRAEALKRDKFLDSNIVRYVFRPMDIRWCYHTTMPNIWKRSRPELGKQVRSGNTFVVTRPAGIAKPEGVPFLVLQSLVARDSIRGHAVAFPLADKMTPGESSQGTIPARGDTAELASGNLSEDASDYLASLGGKQTGSASAETLWMHVIAIGYSSAYLAENADDVRLDWPRIPLPATEDALLTSALLGERIAGLLNTEAEVKSVASGAIRPELKIIGNITATEGGTLDPAHDLLIDAGWGHEGKEGITMPGKGQLTERDYTPAEREAIAQGATALGLMPEQAFAQLGETTCDVYLNSRAYWKNIPANVWEYYIGGYQVIKKWLSYREGKLLGRSLTVEEARYVRDMSRRIAALCLLQPQLDANYAAVKADTYPWPVKG